MSLRVSPPIVDGGWASLKDMKPGDLVLLDLSVDRLIGKTGGAYPRPKRVRPPLCIVSITEGGVPFVDRCGFKGWTEDQIWAWRRLDELEETLDHAAFEFSPSWDYEDGQE